MSTYIKKILLLLVMIIVIDACSSIPLLGRKQVNLLPQSIVNQNALPAYNNFIQESNVISNTAQANWVNQSGQKISASVDKFLRENEMENRIKEFNWEFNLVQNDEVNAWCMPGGKVVFYTGILPIAQDENGVAAIMGHEIAHAVARHGNERLSHMLMQMAGGVALDVAMRDKPEETRQLIFTAYGVGSTIAGVLPYSRLHETEADKLGMIFMAMAGYDPKHAVSLWERMADKYGRSEPPLIVSTHPPSAKRIRDLRSFLPEAMKYYNQP